jgi:metal transporter CNNM
VIDMCMIGQPRAPQVFMLAADTVLDGESLARVLRMGHSRVPVHRPGDRTDLLGVVLVKELVLLDPDDRVPFCPLGNAPGML